MSTSVTNGIGAIIAVTDTAQLIEIVPAVGVDGSHKSAMTLKVWNTGANTVYAVVNAELTDYAEGSAIPIPPDSSFPFVGQPMKKLILACATGETSTANFGAY
jgi:hypothetical protein